jgi:hypothetical protein
MVLHFYLLFQLLAKKLQPTELGKTKVDSLYREDQFYLGLNYNTLLNKPVGISQQKSL